ncbi:MAG TPA: cytidylate kinase-like family protein [Thermomicrobiaceae bacterium]|nr:cytidylate kinase-like family protein [Thermomicrobiaceae bacterium]
MADAGADARELRAVTVSREYGSGGGEIAARLARRLGWDLIDHDIVARVARVLGETEDEAAARDEHQEGLLARILGNMAWVEQPVDVSALGLTPDAEARRYRQAVTEIVESGYHTGRVVVVGRGAQFILAACPDVLHLRVVAPLDLRVAYVMRREGLDEVAARERVRRKDEGRARYLDSQYHHRADDARLYDLVINTGVLALDDAVDFARLALARKAARLALPAGELGPASGLARYPGAPRDLLPVDKPERG